MIYLHTKQLLIILILTALASCGGGGSGNSVAGINGGIGGTGITSAGTIDGFGSIFVNGVEFETDTATVIVDGVEVNEDSLGLGMVVLVSGTVNSDNLTGTATRVEFDDDIQGPIGAITTSADGDSKILSILGLEVIVNRITTVFDDVSFDTLALNDLLEVSGFVNPDNQLVASRIEKKESFVATVSEIELKGSVSMLAANSFSLNTFTVDYSGADLSGIPGATLAEDMQVEVKGTLSGNNITATSIEQEDGLFDDDLDNVEVEGIISNFVDSSNFTVSGINVNASLASLEPGNLNLENGIKVEVEGALVNGILQASSVELRGGEIEIEAQVAAINGSNLIMQLFGGTVSVTVNSQTQMEDGTEMVQQMSITDISSGDFLVIHARQASSDIIATEIKRDQLDDDKLQAPVESFVSNNGITLLGISYLVTGAEYQNIDDSPLSATEFFNLISNGTLVKIKDELTPDGIADKISLED